MAWKKTSRTLPLLDAPVWLYENGRIYIGERNMPPGADGWLWALHYSIPWWNGQEWVGDTADLDDVRPTHWMPLPMPPNYCSAAKNDIATPPNPAPKPHHDAE